MQSLRDNFRIFIETEANLEGDPVELPADEALEIEEADLAHPEVLYLSRGITLITLITPGGIFGLVETNAGGSEICLILGRLD